MRLPKVINSFNQITAERSYFYVWRICYCSTKMKAGIFTGTRAFICFICGMIQWDGYIVTLTISCHAPFVWLHNVTQLLEIFMAMISNYSYTHILEQKSNNTSKFDKFYSLAWQTTMFGPITIYRFVKNTLGVKTFI